MLVGLCKNTMNNSDTEHQIKPRKLYIAGFPWRSINDEWTFIISALCSVALILILNRIYSRKLDIQSFSLISALSVFGGAFVGDIMKSIFMSNSSWSPIDFIVTFSSMIATALILSYFYIIKGHPAKK